MVTGRRENGSTYHASRILIVCLLKPLQEGLASFPHLLARLRIDVLLANMSTPMSQDVDLVQDHESLGDERLEVTVRRGARCHPTELPLLRSDDLYVGVVEFHVYQKKVNADFCEQDLVRIDLLRK
jgi:hypothetical protein